jgi:hypothetical protein
MKRGSITVDGIIALMLLIIITVWMQNYLLTNLDQVNDYGEQLQAKSLAVEYGSRMNTFYATDPEIGDYLLVENDFTNVFGSEATVTMVKMLGLDRLTITVTSTRGTHDSDYPVAEDIEFDDIQNKVVWS